MASNGNPNALDLAEVTAYKQYAVDNRHSYDPGVFVLPVASEASLAVKVRVHGGFGTRTVAFDIVKTGNPPVIPTPVDTVGNDQLVDARFMLPTPTPNLANGNYDWTVSGAYTYVTNGAARVPGVSVYPAVSYPFPVPIQDARAQQSGQTAAIIAADIKNNNLLLDGGWVWPLVSYPSNLLMNPNLIGNV